MRKIKWPLRLVAVFGVCAAYVNKPAPKASPKSVHTYSYWYTSSDGSQMYYGFDLTSMGWTQGLDYDCVYPATICTFVADPTQSHSDFTGNYFYTWNVPTAGINYDGAFSEF